MAARAVGRSVAGIAIDGTPLRVVEDVKCLGAKFDMNVFPHRKVLEQAYIEIGMSRQSQDVSTGIAIRQPSWIGKRIAVVKPRSGLSSWMPNHSRAMDIAHDVRIRRYTADGICSARIIPERGIDDAKWHTGLKTRQVRDLPSA